MQALPITKKILQIETQNDPELRQIYNTLLAGNANTNLQEKYTLNDGFLMIGDRVVIPASLREQVLQELHVGHMGVSKMEALARNYCVWRSINTDIEQLVKACKRCYSVQNVVEKQKVHPWVMPSGPWERIHIGYAGPFMEHNFLIIVDAHSKWPEIIPTKSTKAATTIQILREIFARFGLPYILVSDNASQFKTLEFEDFLRQNAVHHKFSAPYHPGINGQARLFVQIMKQMTNEPGDIAMKLNRFLMQYRLTPQTSTNRSPSELMFGRSVRGRLDIMRSSLQQEVNQQNMNKSGNIKTYVVGQTVLIRFYSNSDQKWKLGTVVKQKSLLNYYVILVDNVEHTRHFSQLRPTSYDGITEYSDKSFINRYIMAANKQEEVKSPERMSRRSNEKPQPARRESIEGRRSSSLSPIKAPTRSSVDIQRKLLEARQQLTPPGQRNGSPPKTMVLKQLTTPEKEEQTVDEDNQTDVDVSDGLPKPSKRTFIEIRKSLNVKLPPSGRRSIEIRQQNGSSTKSPILSNGDSLVATPTSEDGEPVFEDPETNNSTQEVYQENVTPNVERPRRSRQQSTIDALIKRLSQTKESPRRSPFQQTPPADQRSGVVRRTLSAGGTKDLAKKFSSPRPQANVEMRQKWTSPRQRPESAPQSPMCVIEPPQAETETTTVDEENGFAHYTSEDERFASNNGLADEDSVVPMSYEMESPIE